MSSSNYSHLTLSGLVDSDSEDATFEAIRAITNLDSSGENAISVHKARGFRKVAGGKIMKAKATERRISGSKAAPAKKGRRAPLTDRTNEQHATSDTEEVDEFEQEDITMAAAASGDELDASVTSVKPQKALTAKGKTGAAVKIPKKQTSSRSQFAIQADSEEQTQIRPRIPTGRKQTSSKPQPCAESRQRSDIIQETQISPHDVDDCSDEEVEETTPKPPVHYRSVSRATSQQPRQTSVPRRRAGSVSDTERNDPAIRRKLGELTKRLENMDLKYRNLKEIGINQAENNFEKLKKQSEEGQRAASELIASLKADLAAQSAQIKESRDLQKLADTQAADISRLQTQIAQLTSSLSDAQVENKTLSAKLAANRNAAASVESANGKGPGSAVKATGGIRLMGSVEAAQAAQAAQLKEDLYSDLTGLIIRDVKREAEDDVYDCIQTGRNGTLHFKLAIANEKAAESYEDTHCIYIPQLDHSRDRSLMEMLPEYLVDEITFPRPHSAKFYARVVKALTEKQI